MNKFKTKPESYFPSTEAKRLEVEMIRNIKRRKLFYAGKNLIQQGISK